MQVQQNPPFSHPKYMSQKSIQILPILDAGFSPFHCLSSILSQPLLLPLPIPSVSFFVLLIPIGCHSTGDETRPSGGRVISVKLGNYTRRISIDGSSDAIKEAIKSAFGIRSKRAFWLEDEDQIVRSLDRDMPLGIYSLRLDEGVTIKLYHYDESSHITVPTEEKAFYTEEDLRDFLNRRGWSCLEELNDFRNIDNLDDLHHDALYHGVA
ncbi:hypothetical protein Droror1_Dr00007009 [Drosera rotundifolia]